MSKLPETGIGEAHTISYSRSSGTVADNAEGVRPLRRAAMTGCNACRLFFALAKHAFGKWSLFLLGLPILYIVQIRFLFFSAPDFLANRYEELVGFEFLIGLALNAVFLATFAAIGLFCRKVVAANSVEIGDAGL